MFFLLKKHLFFNFLAILDACVIVSLNVSKSKNEQIFIMICEKRKRGVYELLINIKYGKTDIG